MHKDRLGVTADIYREDIELAGSLDAVLSTAFAARLSQAGFLLAEDAAVVYRITTKNASVAAAKSFGANAQAAISIQVDLLSGDDVLGGKLFSATAIEPIGNIESPDRAASEAFTQAIAKVVEDAVADPQLVALLTEAERPGARSPSTKAPRRELGSRPPPPPSSAPEPRATKYVLPSTGVTVRSGPGTAYTAIRSLPRGHEVHETQELQTASGDTWSKVGTSEWIRSDLLSSERPAPKEAPSVSADPLIGCWSSRDGSSYRIRIYSNGRARKTVAGRQIDGRWSRRGTGAYEITPSRAGDHFRLRGGRLESFDGQGFIRSFEHVPCS